MTLEQTKEAIRVMQAFVDGKEVQSVSRTGTFWTSNKSPSWNWADEDFQIKPTKTLRPWTWDEVPIGAWIRSKKHSWKSLIIAVRPDGTFEISDRRISPESALDENEHSLDGGKTWLPCGVVEEEK